MLRLGTQVRFTEAEIAQARQLGLDLSGVNTVAGYSREVVRLVRLLERNCPELLETLATALSERTGRPLPAKLRRVR